MSSDSSAPDTAAADSSKERRELLLKVYETAVAEYRFNVQLTWDRTKFFLLLTLSAITAGVGLLKVAIDNWVLCLFLAAYFGLLLRLTKFGWETQKTGKSYTRQAQLTMTLAQRELGLFQPLEGLGSRDLHLGLAVTPGQRDPIAVIFKRKERSQKEPDARSVVQRVSGVFNVLMLIEGLGVLICIGAAVPETVRTAVLKSLVDNSETFAAHIIATLNRLLPSAC